MTGRPGLLGAALLAVLGSAACSATVLEAEDVATKAEDALQEQVGAPFEVSCPDDVEAEVGAETRCLLTAEGLEAEYGVTVTVTSVEGESAEFDIAVDDEPTGGGS